MTYQSIKDESVLLKRVSTCMEEGYEAVQVTAAPYRVRRIGFPYAVIGCDIENGTYAVWEGYDGKKTMIRKHSGFPTFEAAVKIIV